jgi:hypothetical protein
MKQKLKLIMYLALAAVVFSCAEERDFVKEQNQKPNINFRQVSFKEALSIPIFKNAYQKIAKNSSNFGGAEQARTALEEQFGFTIVAESPVRIITDQHGAVFYILLIERVIKEELVFENLMIRVKDAETAAAIFKYLMTEKGIMTGTEEYFFKEVVITEIIDLNVEGRMFFSTNSDGDTCITTTQLMCSALSSSQPDNHLASFNCFVHAANFGLSSLYETSSSECFPIGGGGNTSSNGSSSGSSNNTGGLGASVGTASNPLEMLAIPCRTGNCIEDNIVNDPCSKVKNLFDPLKANIKSSVENLQTTITPTGGENATVFKKDPVGNYLLPQTLPPSQTNGIQIPIGALVYAYAHTHTEDLYSMFSWTDVNSLFDVLQNTSIDNKTEVTIILVAHDDFHANVVYALTINNITAFTEMVNQKISSVPIPSPYTLLERLKHLDNKLGDKYSTDSNLEHAFLEHFADFNLSLFKADSNLTTWSELKINLPTSPSIPSTVLPIPCNN